MPVTIDEIIRSSRRTLGLEITTCAKLVVRAPYTMPERDIYSFIQRKEQWIERHQRRLLKRLEHVKANTWPTYLDRQRWLNIYRYLAFTIIKQRTLFLAQVYQLTVNEVKISNAKRRWGSCSPNGNLNFNWRLILAPVFVIDYLIVHELAHLVVKNHSRRFWLKVKSMYPEYVNAEEWLKHNGYLLDI